MNNPKFNVIDIVILLLVLAALPFVFFPELMNDFFAENLKYVFALVGLVYVFFAAKSLFK